MGKMAKTKGRMGQTIFSRMLQDRDWTVVDTSDGMSVEDIFAIDLDGSQWAVEVKTTKVITNAHVKQAMDQAKKRKVKWMLANKIEGSSCWLVRRQGLEPVVWCNTKET